MLMVSSSGSFKRFSEPQRMCEQLLLFRVFFVFFAFVSHRVAVAVALSLQFETQRSGLKVRKPGRKQ